MTIITLFAENSTWEGAATDLTSQLWNEGVKKGSILWIDAHCSSGTVNCPYHLTAYWDDRFETNEEQPPIKYKLINKNESFSWENTYNQVDQFVSMLEPRDVISITASCNMRLTCGGIITIPIPLPIVIPSIADVLFVFYYDDIYYHNNFELITWCDDNSAMTTPAVTNETPAEWNTNETQIKTEYVGPVFMNPNLEVLETFGMPKIHREKQTIKHCEVRDLSWEVAAEKIIGELKDKGAKAGQIIAIDAHNDNAITGQAIFSAWWNESLPDLGDLHGYLMKEGINDMTSWKAQAHVARDRITDKSVEKTIKVFSFTSCYNDILGLLYGVTYTFYADDKVVKDGFILDEENIITEKPERRLHFSTFNNTDDKITRKHWTELNISCEKTCTLTSTYERTSGWALTVGAAITLPDIPMTISATAEKNQTEKWEEKKEIVTKESMQMNHTDEFEIKPKSILALMYIEEIAKFSAPYTMTMVSGRVSSGIWKAKKRSIHEHNDQFPLGTPTDVMERELKNTADGPILAGLHMLRDAYNDGWALLQGREGSG